jgi:hypothetical protein
MVDPVNKMKTKEKNQPLLPFERTVLSSKSSRAEKLIVDYVIETMVPLSTVDQKSFKSIISGIIKFLCQKIWLCICYNF